MYDRNSLTHLVFWPMSPDAFIHLSGQDGELLGILPVASPVKGSDLAKMVPDGCSVQSDFCTVLSMSGAIKVSTVGQFDTAVVTERNRPSIEERLDRMERRDRNRAAREQALIAQLKQQKELLENVEVIEDDTSEAGDQASAVDPQGIGDADDTGGDTKAKGEKAKSGEADA